MGMVVQNRAFPQVRQPQRTVLDAFIRKSPTYAQAVQKTRSPVEALGLQQDAYRAAVQKKPTSLPEVAKQCGHEWKQALNDALWTSGLTTWGIEFTVRAFEAQDAPEYGVLLGAVNGAAFTLLGAIGTFFGSLPDAASKLGAWRREFPWTLGMARSFVLTTIASGALAYTGDVPWWGWGASVLGVGLAAGLGTGSASLIPQWARQRAEVNGAVVEAKALLPQIQKFIADKQSAYTYVMGISDPALMQRDMMADLEADLRLQMIRVQQAADGMVPMWEQLESHRQLMQSVDVDGGVPGIEARVFEQIAGRSIDDQVAALDRTYDDFDRWYGRPVHRAQRRFQQLQQGLERLQLDLARLDQQLAVSAEYGLHNTEVHDALRAPFEARFAAWKRDLLFFMESTPWYDPPETTESTPARVG